MKALSVVLMTLGMVFAGLALESRSYAALAPYKTCTGAGCNTTSCVAAAAPGCVAMNSCVGCPAACGCNDDVIGGNCNCTRSDTRPVEEPDGP